VVFLVTCRFMFLEPPWDDEIIKLPVFTTEDIHPRSRECDKIEAVSKPRDVPKNCRVLPQLT